VADRTADRGDRCAAAPADDGPADLRGDRSARLDGVGDPDADRDGQVRKQGKIAEHGGARPEDRNVPLVVSGVRT
jgi:hypothetical protein